MVCLERSLVASCYILQCGLIWQQSEQFCCLEDRATGKNSTWIDFIPHSVHSKYFWQRHMAEREVHSSRLSSLEPEPCSLDCFRQHAHFDKQCMQCSYAGRQEGGQAHKQTHTRSLTHCALVQTQRQMINLCRTTSILPSHSFQSVIMFTRIIQHIASSWWIFIKLFCPDHSTACQMFAAACQGGSSSATLKLHLGHPVSGPNGLSPSV